MKKVIILLFMGLLVSNPIQAKKSVVIIIDGIIKDSITNSPIAGATISANLDISPVQSNEKGKFKFIIMSSAPTTLQVNKEGYKAFEKLIIPQERLNLSIKLVPSETQVRIIFSDFEKKSHISGRIDQLLPSEYDDYKILIYVLTDNWYIHPWAENAEGRGYASIRNDGTWRINTVWRGYQAYRVAFLLTKRETYALPIVKVISDDPDQDILAKINHIAKLIIEAPRGI